MNIPLNNHNHIHLSTLIDTRLLIQANSGGGKSWLLRRLLEQSHGKVQQIVIDLEGEFSTLREKFDYVLVGKGGDTPADPHSASLLAKKLLELNVSAIIDLYELDYLARKRFVKLFIDALVNAPKALWHPCLVVIDEAHVFCPEKGQSEAMGSVIDLATRGRKRGFCAVLATQRLSKLHKDAAAECNNKLIGRTGLDVDMKRAAEELGFSTRDQALSLRNLKAGEFFAFGPAVSTEVIRLEVGPVSSTHPQAGSRILAAPPAPPTAKMKLVLSKLQDLPREAEQEATTIAELQSQIRQLKQETRERKPSAIQVEQLKQRIGLEYQARIKALEDALRKHQQVLQATFEKTQEMVRLAESLPAPDPPNNSVVEPPSQPVMQTSEKIRTDKPLPGGVKRILEVLASRYPMTFTKAQLSTLAKLSPRSGTYGTYLSQLKSTGYIAQKGEMLLITERGLQVAGQPPERQENTVAMWRNKLAGGAQRMFDYLVEHYPKHVSKSELGEAVGMSFSSGTFGTYLSMLRSNGLIEVVNGEVKASENLFL